jgi:hypothetical protein
MDPSTITRVKVVHPHYQIDFRITVLNRFNTDAAKLCNRSAPWWHSNRSVEIMAVDYGLDARGTVVSLPGRTGNRCHVQSVPNGFVTHFSITTLPPSVTTLRGLTQYLEKFVTDITLLLCMPSLPSAPISSHVFQ